MTHIELNESAPSIDQETEKPQVLSKKRGRPQKKKQNGGDLDDPEENPPPPTKKRGRITKPQVKTSEKISTSSVKRTMQAPPSHVGADNVPQITGTSQQQYLVGQQSPVTLPICGPTLPDVIPCPPTILLTSESLSTIPNSDHCSFPDTAQIDPVLRLDSLEKIHSILDGARTVCLRAGHAPSIADSSTRVFQDHL